MLEVARLPDVGRRDLFRATAQSMQVHEAIIEKDFWVCWVLDYLFGESEWNKVLAFKGGTSLSKAYAAIQRFSEDIDLILDWRLLGYCSEEPWNDRSITQQARLSDEANQRAALFLENRFAPVLLAELSDRAGVPVLVRAAGLDVLIGYPRAFTLDAILPEIRLEVGPMAAWVPNELRTITPYAAAHFPHLFKQPGTEVRSISAERTFWEKATILHQEAHRREESPSPARYSRHYYDMYRLHCSPIRDRALGRLELLHEVVEFKMKFYHCSWARYQDAKAGTLRLLPSPSRFSGLRKDYRIMQAMLFGTVPEFEDIMTGLADLEVAINRRTSAAL
jgi:hypothetical protein